MKKEEKVTFLKEKAKELRIAALTMIHNAKSGHPGGSLSAADFMAALYFDELNLYPDDPHWTDRDRFVLSKGHVCPILYSSLALRDYFPYETIYTLRKQGSILQGHPDMKVCPGIDISTGSLGQGLSTAVGMAIAGKRDGKKYRVFSLLGDGECQEGQVWEAVMAAVKYKLDNLIIIIDNNNLQNDNTCDVVMPTGDLKLKFDVFGCDAQGIDGHNMVQIVDALEVARANNNNGKPKVIVGKTVKGKGVSFMEGVVMWHGVAPDKEQFEKAIEEVEAM